MRFENPNKRTVTKIDVDGCEITNGLRCDYALFEENGTEHFVELKGSDIAHACAQITATIKQISRSTVQKRAWIVSSRVPQDDTNINIAKLRLKKQNVKLEIKNSQHSYILP